MPEYLAPGVYVEEVDTGSKPIEGVSTSTAGFIGMTKRGATTGLPQLVTSFADFQRKFGGYFDLGPIFAGYNSLPYAVEGFFTNGGKRVYIMRVMPTGATGATIASTTAQGGVITRLRGDTAAGATKLRTNTLRGVRAKSATTPGTMIQLRMNKNGVTTTSNTLEVIAISRADGEITLSGALTPNVAFEARYTTVYTDVNALDADGAPTALAAPIITAVRANTFVINAKDVGSWGRSIVIQAYHESAARSELESWISAAANDQTKISLKSVAGFYVGAWVEIDTGKQKHYRRVLDVSGPNLTLSGTPLLGPAFAPELAAPNNVTIISTAEFRLLVSFDGVTEQFSGLTLENIPGRYFADQINNRSSLISVVAPPLSGTSPLAYPSGGDGLRVTLDQGGSDGAAVPSAQDFQGTDNGPGQRSGLKALEDIDQVSILAAPGLTSQVVQNALIEQCERLKDRFAILDPQPKSGNAAPDMNDIQAQRNLYDSKYAAIYYPRILVSDPLSGHDIPLAPSGHVAGIFARTDIERGVHKAPANETIRSITGLESKLNKEEQDILNPYPVNINALRDFRSSERGFRVWGARVITSDPDWKYVNVRRLFIYIEESIDEGTQWVVFEPNDEPLWARVRRTVSAFLTSVWRDGALQGATPEEAFFVKCDRTTMSQDDIDNGRLIILVGIAPVKPAEFVIFRIGQWAGGSSIVEG
jgi:phage tail sheath protein FI